MTGMTLADAVKACGGKYIGTKSETTELGRVVIDSRAIEPGDLFVAYKGEKVDGHDYIGAALDKGAACCLCERVPEREDASGVDQTMCRRRWRRSLRPTVITLAAHYRYHGQRRKDLGQGDNSRLFALQPVQGAENGQKISTIRSACR